MRYPETFATRVMNALSFPLLAKELTEIAARRRTYIVRVVYALLLYGSFAAFLHPKLNYAGATVLGAMGMGRDLFYSLIVFQMFGIYLFLPAFTAGLITQEKERDSLVLLFLTELKPWQILLQKYASGLLSIFSFLLIGLPLAAFCYAYGGIPTAALFHGTVVLILSCLQVAALALLCSTRARTTVGAFLGTYIVAAVLVGIVNLSGVAMDHWFQRPDSGSFINLFVKIFPLLLFNEDITIEQTLLHSIAPLVLTFVFLLLARFYLVRRAFAPARNRLLAVFRWLDAAMQRGNRFFGNVTFRTHDRALPEDDPIAWREMSRTTLGRPHYLVRLLLVLEIVVCALSLWAISDRVSSRDKGFLSLLAASLGTLSVLSLSAFAANAFVSERINQTLEVLLTTPLVARDIVRQKARMLTRFMWVLAIPLATVFGIETWSKSESTAWNGSRQAYINIPAYVTWAALSLVVYLPLVLWLSLWIGLKMRTRFRAILTALGVIVAWCAVSIVIGVTSGMGSDRVQRLWLLLSPISIPMLNEFSEMREIFPKFTTIGPACSFLVYALLAFVFRHLCLRGAERELRR